MALFHHDMFEKDSYRCEMTHKNIQDKVSKRTTPNRQIFCAASVDTWCSNQPADYEQLHSVDIESSGCEKKRI